MKIALVGAGYWGSKLLRNLVAVVGSNQVVVVEQHLDRLSALSQEYPGVDFQVDLSAALDDPEVVGVMIATPPGSHAALAREALLAGRHVFVEKPMTTSVADGAALVELAEERARVLMVGHTFLFSPRVQWMYEHLRRPDAGAVHYVTSSRLNLGIHQTEANVIWDLGPHDVSMILHLLGEVPTVVRASGRGLVRHDIADVAFMDLTFPSGVIASVQVSWMAPLKVRNLTVVCERDMLSYDDTSAEEPVKIYNRGIEMLDSADFGENQLTYRYGDTIAPHIAATEPLRLEISAFVRAVQTGETPLSDGRFGLGVVATLEAADCSQRLGGDAVTVEVPSHALHAR